MCQTSASGLFPCVFQEYFLGGCAGLNQPLSCTTSRLRCCGLRLNVRTAAASAASRLGASTSPSTCALLRISDARRDLARRSMASSIFLQSEKTLYFSANLVSPLGLEPRTP